MWKGHYEQIYEGIKVASVQGRRRSWQGDWCIQTMKEGCTWRSVILSVWSSRNKGKKQWLVVRQLRGRKHNQNAVTVGRAGEKVGLNPYKRAGDRRKQFTSRWLAFRFMPPDDPLGRHGPSLENFLRKRPVVPEHKKQPCPYGEYVQTELSSVRREAYRFLECFPFHISLSSEKSWLVHFPWVKIWVFMYSQLGTWRNSLETARGKCNSNWRD